MQCVLCADTICQVSSNWPIIPTNNNITEMVGNSVIIRRGFAHLHLAKDSPDGGFLANTRSSHLP